MSPHGERKLRQLEVINKEFHVGRAAETFIKWGNPMYNKIDSILGN